MRSLDGLCYGYRRVHMLLKREEWAVIGKRIYRLYNGLDWQLRKTSARRRIRARHPGGAYEMICA
jgi:putative transposase